MSGFVCLAGLRARAIFTAMLVLFMGASLVRADHNVVGEWDMKLDYQGNMIPAKLKFENKDGKLTGTWTSQRGSNELTNIKLENNKLTFTRSLNFQDQQFDLQYEGTIDGNKLTGKFTTPMGDMEANGARAEAAKTDEKMPPKEEAKKEEAKKDEAKPGLPGEWELMVESPLGTNKRKLTITDDLKGTYEADFGKFDTKNLKLDGNKLSFDLTLALEGQELPLKFEGTVDGADLKGALKSDQGEGTVTGKKLGGGAAEPKGPKVEMLTGSVDLPGRWKVKFETPDGAATEGELTVKKDEGGKLTGLLATDVGEVNISEIKVDGNKLDFKAEADIGGTKVPVVFAGSVGGDKLKGIASLTLEGSEMNLPVEGSKSKGLTGPVDLSGSWHLQVETPDGATSESDLVFIKTDDKLSAKLTTELGEAAIDSITVQGNAVTFKCKIDFGGQPVPLEFTGTSGGDLIEGIVKVDFEGQTMDLPLKGKRSAAKPADAAKPAADAKTADKPAETASACCKKPTCGPGCKGSAGCGACCKA